MTSVIFQPSRALGPLSGGLCLAATPLFAAMAVITAGDGGMALCGGMAADPLGGGLSGGLGSMSLMYGLMSLVHAGPWLKRLGRQTD